MSERFTNSRRGLFTASEIHKLMKSGKAKDQLFGDTAMTYIYEKIAEIVTGESKQQVSTAATSWGIEHEKDAVMWFEQVTGKVVKHFGGENYCFFDYNSTSGASPDGIIEAENAVVEFKCPFVASNSVTYLLVRGDREERQQWLKKNQIEYYTQVQMEIMSCKAVKGYLGVYDPRAIEPQHRMSIFELLPDIEMVESVDFRIEKASEIVREAIEYLTALP